MENKRNVRLNVQITEAMRTRLKYMALKRHVSLKEYVLGVLFEALQIEDKYK